MISQMDAKLDADDGLKLHSQAEQGEKAQALLPESSPLPSDGEGAEESVGDLLGKKLNR